MDDFSDIGKALMKPLKPKKGIIEGTNFEIYRKDCLKMPQILDDDIALSLIMPPAWSEVVKYNQTHKKTHFLGETHDKYLKNLIKVFKEVRRVTKPDGFCVLSTKVDAYKNKVYPLHIQIPALLLKLGWEFEQDVIYVQEKASSQALKTQSSRQYTPNSVVKYIFIFKKTATDKNSLGEIDLKMLKSIDTNVWATIDYKELIKRLLILYSKENSRILVPFIHQGQIIQDIVDNDRFLIGYTLTQIDKKLACRENSLK